MFSCFNVLMLKKSGNGGFTLKARQIFSVHTTPGEIENAIIATHFGFMG